jgi:ribosomal protein S27E
VSACQVNGCASVSTVRLGGVCDECWDERVPVLAALPPLWHDLHNVLPPGSKKASEDIAHAAPGPRLPLNYLALDALRYVPLGLASWAAIVHKRKGLPVLPDSTRWAHRLSRAMAVLTHSDAELRYSTLSGDYLNELAYMRRLMTRLTGLEPLVHMLQAPCPHCNRRNLVRHNGEDSVRCITCGQDWAGVEYDRLVAVLLRRA